MSQKKDNASSHFFYLSDEHKKKFARQVQESISTRQEKSKFATFNGSNSAESVKMATDAFLELRCAIQDSFASRATALFTRPGPGTNLLCEKTVSWWDEPTNVEFGEELLTKFTEGLKGSDTMNLYQAYVVELTTFNIYEHGPILAKSKNLARDKVLAWLISEATHPISGNKIFDAYIEHYHIVVHEIASCIPDKIIDK